MTYETLNYDGPVKLVDARKTGTITPLEDMERYFDMTGYGDLQKIPEYLNKNYVGKFTLFELGKIHDFEKIGLVKRTTEKPIVVYGIEWDDDGAEDCYNHKIVGLPTPFVGGIVTDDNVVNAYIIKTEDLENESRKTIFEFVFGMDEETRLDVLDDDTPEKMGDFNLAWYLKALEKREIFDESALNNYELRQHFIERYSQHLRESKPAFLVSEKEQAIKKSFRNAMELLQYLGYDKNHLVDTESD